jgi:type II secretory pathway component PulK
MRHRTVPLDSPRRGIALIAVLVVVAVLTLAAYRFTEVMTAELQAADSYARSVQARVYAESGIAYASALLASPDTATGAVGSVHDNPALFMGVLVQESPSSRFRGRFSIVSPADPDLGGSSAFRFGATDECGKINLNALLKLDSSGRIAHDMLLKLPNMTEEVVNAILDWIDPDEQPRAGGAENEYYSTLRPSYQVKNGPLDSLEELLFVRGVTPQLLFGNDRNRNGGLDPEEDGGDGLLDRGWSAYLTVYSRELNVDSEGAPRIYINDSDLNALYEKLNAAVGEEMASFIIAYRLYAESTQNDSGSTGGSGNSSPSGGSSAPGMSQAGSSRGGSSSSAGGGRVSRNTLGDLGQQQRRARSVSSLYLLIDGRVSIPSSQPNEPPTVYASPLSDPGVLRQSLPVLLDKLTTVRDPELPARVNINTAPRAVLAALPNLDEAAVQAIFESRLPPSSEEVADPVYQTPTWLLTDVGLSPQTLRSLERYITGRSQVYRIQVVGHFDSGGPAARVEAVIDTNAGRPRVVYYRDLTELGKGFSLQLP